MNSNLNKSFYTLCECNATTLVSPGDSSTKNAVEINTKISKTKTKKNKNNRNAITNIEDKLTSTLDLSNHHKNLSKTQNFLLNWHHWLYHLNMSYIKNMALKCILPKQIFSEYNLLTVLCSEFNTVSMYRNIK